MQSRLSGHRSFLQAHGKCLLAAGTAALKGPVEIVGDAGEIAQIFQQSEEREKHGHRRQHHRYHPAQDAPGSVQQQTVPERRQPDAAAQRFEQELHTRKERAQTAGEDVGPADGEIEDQREQGEHQRIAQQAAGQQPVEPPVPLLPYASRPAHDALTERGGRADTRFGDADCLPLRLRRLVKEPVERLEQDGTAAPLPRHEADHRHAEPFLQQRQIRCDAAPRRFVEQIHAYQDAPVKREDLQNEVEVPLQARGVADHDDRVCLSGAEIVPGQGLFR